MTEAAAVAFTTSDLSGGNFELAAGGMVTREEIAVLMSKYARRGPSWVGRRARWRT